jgi:hypothetical protein
MKLIGLFGAFMLVIVFMQGCAVNKQLVPTGGSRADGTVKLSYEYGMFEVPQLDAQQGLNAARQRCAAWGYTDAEPFGGTNTKCNRYSGRDCVRWFVTIEYQCTGTPTASR